MEISKKPITQTEENIKKLNDPKAQAEVKEKKAPEAAKVVESKVFKEAAAKIEPKEKKDPELVQKKKDLDQKSPNAAAKS